jgi:16S rRNA (cytosine967-C5)-methyltransferase
VQSQKSGYESRRLALSLLEAVIVQGKPLDEALDAVCPASLAARDRAFAHAMAAAALRHKGEAEVVLRRHLARPLPRSSGPAPLILLLGAAQLLFLNAPPHATIDLSVTLANADAKAKHFARLINAVLRKVSAEGRSALAGLDATGLNTPAWLMKSWSSAYGEAAARAVANSHLAPAALDITVKGDHATWAARLGGTLLPTGSIRLAPPDAIASLPGYAEGAWWVQDAAAALPARLLGEIGGRRVLDLCAAPGGKTAQLAAAGAAVTAVDIAAARLERVAANLARLRLKAELVTADVLAMAPEALFDAVLLDAPCSATGTIRRHPDLPYLKTARQVDELAKLQGRLLAHASRFVRPGGLLVYCTCSLQPDEGEAQAEAFLRRQPAFQLVAVEPDEIGNQAHFITAAGDLRTLPSMRIGNAQGLDGFFAARFRRS